MTISNLLFETKRNQIYYYDNEGNRIFLTVEEAIELKENLESAIKSVQSYQGVLK